MLYVMIRMTFDEYDRLIEKFDHISVKACWPTHKMFTIEINKHPEKYMTACLYLLEKGKTKSIEEEYIRSLIDDLVKKNLYLYDPEEEDEQKDLQTQGI